MTQKVFITRSGTANFFCPECGKTRQMDVTKFRDIKKEVKLKVTCSCKHKFSVILERRQHIRMQVNLKGVVLLSGKKYPVDIINISRFGLRVRTKGSLDLKLLDKVFLEFVLDDASGSTVTKEVVVRTIRQPEFGLEFVERDHYDKLGTYLLFNFS
ncbi:MAG: PilZ domain-containing protein [Desulfobacula sp.]|nr:PilZ domain-containing protein [Desulfobacula sp.]